MKAFTDIEQSKKLAEILPIESADMKWFTPADDESEFIEEVSFINNKSEYTLFDKVTDWYDTPYIPCWSLAALLDVLPVEVEIHRQTDEHKIYYYYVESYMKRMRKEIYLSTERHESLIDACYEMILKLKEKNLL